MTMAFNAQAFWSRIDRSGGPDACWPWARPHSSGYGQVWRDRRLQRSHRVAYELLVGPIPEGLDACHGCDNRSCCNPAHLFLGTQADNMRDMDAKGRRVTVAPLGEANGRSRLTAGQVVHIRQRAREGEPDTRLARAFGVSESLIGQIRRRAIWRHLEEPRCRA